MSVAYHPEEIIAIVSPEFQNGSTSELIRSIASLSTARPGDLSFLGNPKYKAKVANTAASIVLVPLNFVREPATDQLFLYVANPSTALAKVCSRIEQSLWPKPPPSIHSTASVDPTATIASTATIGPLCVVEGNVEIGEGSYLQGHIFVGHHTKIGRNCWIMPGCIISTACELGHRVRLQSGVVVGSDGFGYEFVAGHHEKVPQVGNVVVGNDVEVGANTTIDRARFSHTIIGEGTKVDNLVQIGHNVVIGRHCILCAQVGVSGSTTIEDYVILGGQVGVGGHITIARGTKAGGQTGIVNDTNPGTYLNGTPAISYVLERRLQVLHQRLPELFKRVSTLEGNPE